MDSYTLFLLNSLYAVSFDAFLDKLDDIFKKEGRITLSADDDIYLTVCEIREKLAQVREYIESIKDL